MINETYTKNLEIVRSPLKNDTLPSIDKLSKSKFFINSFDKVNLDRKRLENLSDLKFEGKKLFEEEMNAVKMMKGRKYLHKKDDEILENENYESYVLNTEPNKKRSIPDLSYLQSSMIR